MNHNKIISINEFYEFINSCLLKLKLTEQYHQFFKSQNKINQRQVSRFFFIEQALPLLFNADELQLFQYNEQFWIENTYAIKSLPDIANSNTILDLLTNSIFSILDEKRIRQLAGELLNISKIALAYYEHNLSNTFEKDIDEFILLQSQRNKFDIWLIGRVFFKLGYFSSFSQKTCSLYCRYFQIKNQINATQWHHMMHELSLLERCQLYSFCEKLYDNHCFQALLDERNNERNDNYCRQKILSDQANQITNDQLIQFICDLNIHGSQYQLFYDEHFNNFAFNYNNIQLTQENQDWILFWKAIFDFHRRFTATHNIQSKIQLTSPQVIYDNLRFQINQKAKEAFFIVILNNKNQYLDIIKISEGIVNQTLIHPREIFAAVLVLRASKVLLIHNHPSGDPSPSKNDKDMTKVICDAAAFLKIEVIDHIIFGQSSYYSFQAENLL